VNLGDLVAAGETMREELGREYYLTGAGLKTKPEFQAIYDRHPAVAGDDAISVAKEEGSRALLEWVVGVQVGQAVAKLEEQQLAWEQSATLSLDGQQVPFLRAPIDLANSPDRDFRLALDAARSEAGAQALNGLRRERFQREHEVLGELGLGAYVEALSTLSGIALEALGEESSAFLDCTKDAYVDGLGRLAKRRLGVPLSDLRRADAVWLSRADQFDGAFPAATLVETAAAQMAAMGLDHAAAGRVQFDTAERDGKQPRAFCVPVRVPDEVYLVIRPHGGHADYRTFWHELGHAMHFASVDPELSFEARWLGDNSVTEGFAMLWDHLTLNRRWMHHYTELSSTDTAELSFELAVGELFLARRYAAKLCYELELHRSDFTSVGPRYAELLSTATGFRFGEDDFLLDVDPGFYAARYLRAWQLEALLSATLVEQYDEDWYRNPRAGGWVHELMRRGQGDPADRLAIEATGRSLDFELVIHRLEQTLA
jgi:hypothetical protein